ncbi:tyrosine-type recombinase/integrase [Actinomadura sp. WAC 06369]|uniref:tyrosine-type recombinase/integrase n=1 Tax=Actinomadura sp. WAC 06369 TaxID=2203193 RepID=UPI000F77D05A|nr:site-specific integrase [Actinomadura sp. WAC 06369]RSN59566.1 site-specific integrase [Actinomadura sp. WAC 06369]
MADKKHKRRANGEGTIYQRKDGRWEGAAYVLTTDGTTKRVSRYGKTREEVRKKLVQAQERSGRGLPVANRPWKVGEYLDYWLEEVVRPSKRWNTYKKYEQTVRLYLKPGLGKQSLDRLRVAKVQSFLNQQIKDGHSLAKVHVMRMTLCAALTRAMREELVTVNVAGLTTLPPAPTHKAKPWTADEARAFLDAARNEPLYPAFVLLMVYGLRRGEVLGLGWDDLDMDEMVMRVRWQLQREDGKLVRTPVKTNAGDRGLPMLPLIWDAFVELADRQLYAKRRAGADWEETGLIFTTRNGRPIEPRNLSRVFERICTNAGLRRIRLHDLRHVTATLLKRLGVPARDAQAILGHAKISTTLEIYTDSNMDDHRIGLGKLAGELFRLES